MGHLTRGLLAVLICVLVIPAIAADKIHQSKDHRFRVVTLAEGLEHPWSLAFLPNGDMLVTERPGRLRIVRAGKLLDAPVRGVPDVAAVGQGGLLDVVPHPDFKTNRLIYLSYAAQGPGGFMTRLGRGRFEDDRIQGFEVLFQGEPNTRAGQHFAGRVAFDEGGYVYMSIGDRGNRPRAQRLDDLAGSVIRLHDDGSIPRDNPFRLRVDVRPEIYSYGHRNPQGMARHPKTGRIWAQEHGPQGGDEVNLIKPGANYGWPVITHGKGYDNSKVGIGSAKAGMEQPLWYWVPSIAPSGMAFYDGDAFPAWKGSLFVGALKDRLLSRLTLDGDRVVSEERLIKRMLGRIRDVRAGPDGLIYLLSDHGNGRLARLEPVE